MPRPATDAEEIAENLQQIFGALRRRARSAAMGRTIALPLLQLLKRLDLDGPATTADLARAEMITPQTAGAAVAKLEEAGWVSRKDDANDGRRRLVVLTASGRKVLTEARALSHEWLSYLLVDRLDATELRLVAAALPALRKLALA